MPCDTYLEWLDTPASESASLPEHIARHLSACAQCRQVHAEIQAFRNHCASMSPDSKEAMRLWESLAPLIPAQPASPTTPAAGPQSSGATSTAVKASVAVSAPVGIGPIVILAAGILFIGVLEYGLSALRSRPPSPSSIQSSKPSATPAPADVSSTPAALQRPIPAGKASETVSVPDKPQPVSPPIPAVRPPVIPERPAAPSVPLTVPHPEASPASGNGDELIDGFVPMTAPAGGQD
ncbi:MAG TPA: hypothetical protein PLU72_11335 [Candidatus Ozemobacteraceae bacterium]|nr:hypothetical protein [Candidatus Ozemobacteraceae bacterium]HQG29152.1 hypothetical protein [Candidatus Ozemobacteraceae bacterium]